MTHTHGQSPREPWARGGEQDLVLGYVMAAAVFMAALAALVYVIERHLERKHEREMEELEHQQEMDEQLFDDDGLL